MSQYTIIYKYGKQYASAEILKGAKKFFFKKQWRKSLRTGVEWKGSPQLESATSGSIKKATKYDMNIFQGKNFKT